MEHLRKINGRFPGEVARIFSKYHIRKKPTPENLQLAVLAHQNFAGDLYSEIVKTNNFNGDETGKQNFISKLKKGALAVGGIAGMIENKGKKQPEQQATGEADKSNKKLSFKTGAIIGISIIVILAITLVYLAKKK